MKKTLPGNFMRWSATRKCRCSGKVINGSADRSGAAAHGAVGHFGGDAGYGLYRAALGADLRQAQGQVSGLHPHALNAAIRRCRRAFITDHIIVADRRSGGSPFRVRLCAWAWINPANIFLRRVGDARRMRPPSRAAIRSPTCSSRRSGRRPRQQERAKGSTAQDFFLHWAHWARISGSAPGCSKVHSQTTEQHVYKLLRMKAHIRVFPVTSTSPTA